MANSKKTSKGAADAGDVEVVVEILINRTIVDGFEKSKGKQLRLLKRQADALCGLTPPAARIIGV